jgi:phospholipid/cholesterol/gamma-HCH transport system ATP-binding protein
MQKNLKENSKNIISVKGLVNMFGKQLVHDHISFDIMQGEIIGIVGGSGSGKSVLLRSMIGLHKPDEGRVMIDGRNVNDIRNSEIASLFGVLFQQGALFSSLTVGQNIILPLREHTDLSNNELEIIAGMKLAMVGLEPDTARKMPSELSGGMIKRAALARSIAFDPKILFLDEPTAGLDPLGATAFDELILKLNEILGITVILVTHDLDTLFGICDRAAVLVDKQIMIDTLDNLLKSENQWVRDYFHGPRARSAMQGAEKTEIDDNGKLRIKDGN